MEVLVPWPMCLPYIVPYIIFLHSLSAPIPMSKPVPHPHTEPLLITSSFNSLKGLDPPGLVRKICLSEANALSSLSGTTITL